MSVQELETILNYIVELGPAITAILSIIVSIIIAIKKFGGLSKDSVKEMNDLAKKILDSNDSAKSDYDETKRLLRAVIIENGELKKEIKEISKIASKIREVDKGEENE